MTVLYYPKYSARWQKEDEILDEVEMFQGCRIRIKKQREVLGTATMRCWSFEVTKQGNVAIRLSCYEYFRLLQ